MTRRGCIAMSVLVLNGCAHGLVKAQQLANADRLQPACDEVSETEWHPPRVPYSAAQWARTRRALTDAFMRKLAGAKLSFHVLAPSEIANLVYPSWYSPNGEWPPRTNPNWVAETNALATHGLLGDGRPAWMVEVEAVPRAGERWGRPDNAAFWLDQTHLKLSFPARGLASMAPRTSLCPFEVAGETCPPPGAFTVLADLFLRPLVWTALGIFYLPRVIDQTAYVLQAIGALPVAFIDFIGDRIVAPALSVGWSLGTVALAAAIAPKGPWPVLLLHGIADVATSSDFKWPPTSDGWPQERLSFSPANPPAASPPVTAGCRPVMKRISCNLDNESFGDFFFEPGTCTETARAFVFVTAGSGEPGPDRITFSFGNDPNGCPVVGHRMTIPLPPGPGKTFFERLDATTVTIPAFGWEAATPAAASE